MTILRVSFAGRMMKVEHKKAGDKAIAEISLCRKHKGRAGKEDTYTWLRVTLWEPPTWMTPRLVKGGFIAGSGELELRSFEHNNEKRTSLECRSTSFDVEVDGGEAGTSGAIATPVREVPAKVASQPEDPSIPF